LHFLQESLANAKVSAQHQCVYMYMKALSEGTYGKSMQRNVMSASQICEVTQNFLRKFKLMAVQGHPRIISWCQSKTHMQLPISH